MVSIEKCADYNIDNVRNALKRAIENIGGLQKYIKPGMKVAVKPNLIMKKRPEEAATTHPAVVRAVCEMAQEIVAADKGGEVIIVESPGGIYSERALKGLYQVCGISEALKDTGVKLNFDVSDVEINIKEGMYLKKASIIKPLADADFIINIPKLKTHGQMAYTGAVKNMFGAVPGVLKTEYHFKMPRYDQFANALIDIFLAVKPGLNVMDAVIGMEGQGPTAGNPKHIGAILVSDNAFELDFAALTLVNANPRHVPVIKEAIKRNLCPGNLDDIEIATSTNTNINMEDLKVKNFNMPQMDALRTLDFLNNSLFRFITGKIGSRPVFVHEICRGCAECINSCPVGIIKLINGKPRADRSRCINCFCCQELCPANAVHIKRPALVDLLIRITKKI